MRKRSAAVGRARQADVFKMLKPCSAITILKARRTKIAQSATKARTQIFEAERLGSSEKSSGTSHSETNLTATPVMKMGLASMESQEKCWRNVALVLKSFAGKKLKMANKAVGMTMKRKTANRIKGSLAMSEENRNK